MRSLMPSSLSDRSRSKMRKTAEPKNDSAPVLLESGDGRVDVELRKTEPTTSDQKFLEFGIGREFETHGPVLIPKLFGWNLASIAPGASTAVFGSCAALANVVLLIAG